jgi:cytidylate kinase
VLALDGPGGSGKGTVGREVAARLGWQYLDSGAIYRCVALAALQAAMPLDDEAAVAGLAGRLDLRFGAGAERTVWLGGQDVSDDIQTEACGAAASRIAALPAVRQALVEKQRSFLQAPGLVADGRDMGTVIFPEAPCKVFLTASAEVRAERRYRQLLEMGEDVSLRDLTLELRERDRRDRERAVAPLVPAADAVLLDTSHVSIEEVTARVLELVHARVDA